MTMIPPPKKQIWPSEESEQLNNINKQLSQKEFDTDRMVSRLSELNLTLKLMFGLMLFDFIARHFW